MPLVRSALGGILHEHCGCGIQYLTGFALINIVEVLIDDSRLSMDSN